MTRTTSPNHSTASNKAIRLQERDAPFPRDETANKRYRASPYNAFSSTCDLFSSIGTTTAKCNDPMNAYRDMGLPGLDVITPEEQFQALKESSHNLMEAMSISQQNTQECTQTLEESPNMCVMRFVLHRDVDRALTADQKSKLEQHGLYRIELDRLHPRVSLGRESYTKVFDTKFSGIDPLKLSRTHCTIECMSDTDSSQVVTYVSHKSTNGIRLNGKPAEKGQKYRVVHGDVITLLSSRQGNVLLGYVAEDPHVHAAMGGGARHEPPNAGVAINRTQEESQRLFETQEHTLGVLFAAPIVGKDVQGKYHPIAELDIKREYLILQESLVEASKYARRPVVTNENGIQATSSTLFQYPHQINVRAMFANTENFRNVVTVGCNALHFSCHGDERHLYFEDGMGLVHPVPHSSLQELFTAGGEATLRLVFVSACSSAPLAQAFVSCGIPHVIGVKSNQKIEDYAAIEFTRSFYLALATGKSVGASFMIAQQAVAKSPNIRNPVEVSEKFVLLPENGDHAEVIFPLVTMEASSSSELGKRQVKKYPKLWFDDLPAMCQGFCNRAVEVYKICLALMLTQSRITRLVTICGEEGIGKTSVAHAVINYVAPRISAEGGVKVFSVPKIALEEADRNVERALRKELSKTTRSSVLSTVETMIRTHLEQNRARFEFKSLQMLLVLDGCDAILSEDSRRERFRVFLSDLLTNNASLKIIITARTSISTNGAVAGHGERVYTLTRFTAKMAAKMLLSLVSRPIRVEEIKRAKLMGTTTDKMELIASHPALLSTLGIPKRVADLAGRLNEVLMDDISVDVAAMDLME